MVTGGAGFIGTHLTQKLLEKGIFVTVLDNLSTSKSFSNKPGEVCNVQGDAADMDLVEELVVDSDIVFHLAASVGVFKVLESPFESAISSTKSGTNVFSACAKLKKPVVFASTSEVYGKLKKNGITEEDDRILGHPGNLRWLYSGSKALLEGLAYALARDRGLEFSIVRLFNTVGPGQSSDYGMVLPRFVKAAINNFPITVFGDGTQVRTFCDVRDIVTALSDIDPRKENFLNQIFNLGGSESITIMSLAKLVKELAKSESRILLANPKEFYGNNPDELSSRIPDTALIRNVLAWQPTISLRDTIIDMLAKELE